MSDEFIEPNLGVASYLATQGYRLKKFVRIGRAKVAFVFTDFNGRAAEVAESFSRGATAPAELLLKSFGDLKRQMYETKTELQEVQNVPSRNTHPKTSPQ